MTRGGRRAPWRGLVLVLLLLVASCGRNPSSGGESNGNWRQLEIGRLITLRVPSDVAYRPYDMQSTMGILTNELRQLLHHRDRSRHRGAHHPLDAFPAAAAVMAATAAEPGEPVKSGS